MEITLHVYTFEWLVDSTTSNYEVDVLGVFLERSFDEIKEKYTFVCEEDDVIYTAITLPFEIAYIIKDFLSTGRRFSYLVYPLTKESKERCDSRKETEKQSKLLQQRNKTS